MLQWPIILNSSVNRFTNISPFFSLKEVPVLVIDFSKDIIGDDHYREEVFKSVISFAESLQNNRRKLEQQKNM